MDRKTEKKVEDDIMRPEKDAAKVLSKRTRMLNTSEFKRQVFYALEDMQQGKALTKLVGVFLYLLIVANAVVVFFSAQPSLEPLTANILNVFYVFSTICFFLEYVARVWVSDLAYGNCTRARARVKYIFSALGIIDFLSFAPSMISWFLPVTPTIIHAVNVLRLIRLLKVTRYMRGFRTMARVMRKHYQEVVAAFLVIIIVMIVTCVVMYEVEHEAQPDKFTNLFQSFWFAVETVTTTGYGDLVPITTLGKICGIIVMMLSLGLIAIPGGIFSAGFVAEFQNANMRKIERDVKRNTRMNKEETQGDGDTKHDKDSGTAHEKGDDDSKHDSDNETKHDSDK